jgi:hypothetical protein
MIDTVSFVSIYGIIVPGTPGTLVGGGIVDVVDGGDVVVAFDVVVLLVGVIAVALVVVVVVAVIFCPPVNGTTVMATIVESPLDCCRDVLLFSSIILTCCGVVHPC